MSGGSIVNVEAELSKLREFQRRTAEHAFRRMFEDNDYTSRFLVADEVGLGKTYVAKGVVAQVLDKLGSICDERHDIVYICSNAAIARQNIRKLVPADVATPKPIDRLSMLLHPNYQPETGGEAEVNPVNLVALTPATSFKMGNRSGRLEERILAAALLSAEWKSAPLASAAVRRIFWYPSRRPDSELTCRANTLLEKLNCQRGRAVRRSFREQLKYTNAQRKSRGKPSLKVEFNRLAKQVPSRRTGKWTSGARESRLDFMREVRHIMARTGISLLNPDLVILDEFQRFKDLLNPDEDHRTEVTEHAQAFFGHRDPGKEAQYQQVRCLLLSATPYKSYSAAGEPDDHYADFVETCRFLFENEDTTGAVKQLLADLRGSLRDIGDAARLHHRDAQQPDGRQALESALELAQQQCEALSARLRKVMSRTERLAATPDRSGMLAECKAATDLAPDDVRAYVQIGAVADELRLNAKPTAAGQGAQRITDPMEFWKSSPYALNFMGHDDYVIKRAFRDQATNGDLARFDPHGVGMLDWEGVDGYGEVDPRNPRLRWLLDDLDGRNAFDVLWIPPSLPYYRAETAYDTVVGSTGVVGGTADEAAENGSGLTKRLIFSGWRVVPRAVSSLVSYEAERRSIGAVRGGAAGDTDASAVADDGAVKYTSPRHRHGGGNLALSPRSTSAGTSDSADAATERDTHAGMMSSLQFMLPSPVLAELGDPRNASRDHAPGPLRPLADLRAQVAQRIAKELRTLLDAEERAALDESLARAIDPSRVGKDSTAPRRGDQQWYWLTPLLLDAARSPDRFGPWFWCSAADLGDTTAAESERGSRRGGAGLSQRDIVDEHVDRAWSLLIAEIRRRDDAGLGRYGPDERGSSLTGRLRDELRAAGVDESELAEWFDAAPRATGSTVQLGRIPGDLIDVLTDVAVGGPAVCALRSLAAVLGTPSQTSDSASVSLTDPAFLAAAAHVGNAFRHLFNRPEAAALVTRSAQPGAPVFGSPELPYWRKAITHCVGGNLGALLDEHVHMLRDWLTLPAPKPVPARGRDSDTDGRCDIRAVREVSQKLGEALRVRTSTIKIDTPVRRSDGRVVVSDDDESPRGRAKKATHSMRHRFAVAYGAQQSDDGEQRDEHVSTAFNSPFWPFVLTSTSVGQEGLDFHLWCHAVVHWNLPSNPVDLEQREGRVHRYKNHAVRRNLAAVLGAQALRNSGAGEDLWETLFELGRSGDDEMVPCWVYPGSEAAAADASGPSVARTVQAEPDGVSADDGTPAAASIADGQANRAPVARIERWVPMLPLSREETQLARLRQTLGAYRLAIGQPRQSELLDYLSRSGVLDDESDTWLASELAKIRINLTPPESARSAS